MDNQQTTSSDKPVIGSTVSVEFTQFQKQVTSKVDTGATTCCIHAVNIKQNGQSVSFTSPMLSNNVITVDAVGTQQVHSADAGGVTRPVIALDVVIAGVQLQQVHFNLNDRSAMDNPVLIGQNALTDNFVVDCSKDNPTSNVDTQENQPRMESIDQPDWSSMLLELQSIQRAVSCITERIHTANKQMK